MTKSTLDSVDKQKLHLFQSKVMGDLAAASGVACAYIGDRLGLYKAMAKHGPMTSEELAKATGTHERYVREWLLNQAAGGYAQYAAGKYSLSAENAEVLADENSPYFCGGGFQAYIALMQAAPLMVQRLKTGEGLSWEEQSPDLFEGTERFFKPAYIGQLTQSWIPSIPGLLDKLQSGATVADVGCGHGVSTIVMAKAFPKSTFWGFDSHGPSIENASRAAKEAGVGERTTFAQAGASEIADKQFDLVAFFDCLHDMGEPGAALKRAKEVLKPGGCVMLIEPMGGAHVEDNFNDIGRAFTGASVLCCTPNAIASGNTALGTVATDEAIKAVAISAGFNSFKRATATPFNRVFELRVN